MSTTRENYNKEYISAAGTNQLKSRMGILHAIVVTETAAGTIKVIDNTTGSTVNIAQLKANITEGTYTFNCRFQAGLRIISSANSKFTVIYR